MNAKWRGQKYGYSCQEVVNLGKKREWKRFQLGQILASRRDCISIILTGSLIQYHTRSTKRALFYLIIRLGECACCNVQRNKTIKSTTLVLLDSINSMFSNLHLNIMIPLVLTLLLRTKITHETSSPCFQRGAITGLHPNIAAFWPCTSTENYPRREDFALVS